MLVRVLLGLLLVLGPVGAAAQPPTPLALNFILSLTGGASFLGQAEQQSFVLEEKVVNDHGGIGGRAVKFVYADDASNPQVGIQLVNQLLAQKVNVFAGSPLAAVCQALIPLLTAGPVEYCLSPPVHPPARSFVFTVGASAEDLGAVLLRYLHARGISRIAIITTTDATGHDVDDAFTALLARPENKPFTVVDYEHFNPTDLSVAAQLARIKAANAQFLLSWTVGTPTGTLLRGIRDAGLDLPVAESNANELYAEMNQFAAILPNELIFPSYRAMTEGAAADTGAVHTAQASFFAALRANNTHPDIASVTAWDGVMIVVDALRRLGPRASAQQIRDYILGQSHYAGVNGYYDFRDGSQRGLSANELVINRWDATHSAFTLISKPGGAPL